MVAETLDNDECPAMIGSDVRPKHYVRDDGMPTDISDRIMASAARCLAERGYARTSLRDIAREAGVALSQLHYYFGSKQQLVDAVRRACLGSYAAELRQRLERVAEGEGGTLAAMLEAFHDSVRSNPALFRLCLELRLVAASEAAAEQVRAIHRDLVDLLAQHLRRLGLAGGGGDVLAAARALLAALDGLVLQAVVEPAEPAVGAAHRVVGEWVSARPCAEEGGPWSSTACGR